MDSNNNMDNNEVSINEVANMADIRPPQFSGYGLISSPTQQQYGTLGYNPGVQSFNPQQQSGIVFNRGANPQYGGGYNHVYHDQTYVVPGFNPSSTNMMYTSDMVNAQEELLRQMNKELDEYNNNNNLYYNNYYGNLNRTNPYIVEKYKKKQFELEQQAKQRRIDFNKRLSTIAHTCLDGKAPDEEYLNSIYDDRTVTIPAKNVEAINKIGMLEKYTADATASQITNYAYHDKNITNEHDKVINPKSSLLEFLDTAGELYALGMQEEVNKARRDKSKIYDNSDNYRKYLMQQIQRRDGTVNNSLFPTLANSSNVLDDGTLQVNLPDWLNNKDRRAESEQKYAENRQKFIESIYNPRR